MTTLQVTQDDDKYFIEAGDYKFRQRKRPRSDRDPILSSHEKMIVALCDAVVETQGMIRPDDKVEICNEEG